MILFVSVLHLCIFKEKKKENKKLNSLCIDTSEGLFSKIGPKPQKERTKARKYVALSCLSERATLRYFVGPFRCQYVYKLPLNRVIPVLTITFEDCLSQIGGSFQLLLCLDDPERHGVTCGCHVSVLTAT